MTGALTAALLTHDLNDFSIVLHKLPSRHNAADCRSILRGSKGALTSLRRSTVVTSPLHSSSAINLQEQFPFRRGLAQSQRALVLHVVISDRAQFVPEIQACGDGCANANANAYQQEPAVRRHPNRRCGCDRRRNYQSSRASDRNRHKDLVEPPRPTVASVRCAVRSTFLRQLYYLREQQ